MRCVRATALVLASLLAFAATASARRPKCPSDCQTCYVDGCSNLGDCLSQADDTHTSCVENVPAFPGKCKLTSDRIRECDAMAADQKISCFVALRRKIQKDCHDAGAPCRIGIRGARRACEACGVSASSAPRTSPADLLPQQSANDPGGCQAACIRSIVRNCYADCQDACDGEDPRALPKCQGACKDAQCGTLQSRCTDGGDQAGTYMSCCLVFGSCAADVDCTVTTTTTRVTTTQTSSTTTTVTGATTTSTTL